MRQRPELLVRACHNKAARKGFVRRVKDWAGRSNGSTMRCCYLAAAASGVGVVRTKNRSGVCKEAQ